jgi:hypothetical protein
VKLFIYLLLALVSYALFLGLWLYHNDHWALLLLALNVGLARMLELEVKRYKARKGLR